MKISIFLYIYSKNRPNITTNEQGGAVQNTHNNNVGTSNQSNNSSPNKKIMSPPPPHAISPQKHEYLSNVLSTNTGLLPKKQIPSTGPMTAQISTPFPVKFSMDTSSGNSALQNPHGILKSEEPMQRMSSLFTSKGNTKKNESFRGYSTNHNNNNVEYYYNSITSNTNQSILSALRKEKPPVRSIQSISVFFLGLKRDTKECFYNHFECYG